MEIKYADILQRLGENKSKILVGIISVLALTLFGAPVGLGRIFLFIILLAITAIISYYIGLFRSPIDASPTFFLMIPITWEYGFFYAVIFVIFGNLVPTIISGAEVGADALLFTSAFIFISLISGLFENLGIVLAGLLLTVLLVVIGFFINKSIQDEQGMILTLAHAGISAVYFVILGNTVSGLF